MVRVSDLPLIDRPDIRSVPSSSPDRACGCYYCAADWRGIAGASVALLREGLDPLDRDAILSRAEKLLPHERERGWLMALFGSEPITVLRGDDTFTSGTHRTHALRMHGVEECVVYTGSGELPYEPGSAI